MMMKKQQGMTLISWVIVLGMIAFLATIVIRILPMYQEYFGVVKIMEGMEDELRTQKLTKAQANLLLMRRFNTGYITSVKKDNIEISRGKNSSNITKIVIDYEVRVPFIAQIDLIGHFHKEIDVEPKIRR
jgi:Tfp pilus assembly major pilin PilA